MQALASEAAPAPLAVALLALAGAQASAKTLRVGNIIIHADGGFAPKSLPKHEDAPITLHGGGPSRPSVATRRRSSKRSTSNSTGTA